MKMAETETMVEARGPPVDRPEPSVGEPSIAEVSNGAGDSSPPRPGTPKPATPKAAVVEASPAAKEEVINAEKVGVALFDLDHTIIDTNSSWHWLQHEVNNGKVGLSMLMTALYWFSRYALGFGAGAERAGAEAAELYAGEKEDDLNERVVTFFRKELSHRVRPGCKETMDKHKSDGVRCVMCTSSWQHPARAAAALYGLEPDPKDVISSVMEVDPTSGVLTGKIQKVAYGDGKCVVTKEWADANNIDLNLCWFYTDSMSDVALMEAVGFPVAVNPDARLRKHAETKGWPVEDWGLAEDKSKKPRYAYACLTLKGSSQGPG